MALEKCTIGTYLNEECHKASFECRPTNTGVIYVKDLTEHDRTLLYMRSGATVNLEEDIVCYIYITPVFVGRHSKDAL